MSYLSVFRNSVEKLQNSLEKDKNNGKFTSRPIHIFIISLSVILRMKNISDKICRGIRNTFYVQ